VPASGDLAQVWVRRGSSLATWVFVDRDRGCQNELAAQGGGPPSPVVVDLLGLIEVGVGLECVKLAPWEWVRTGGQTQGSVGGVAAAVEVVAILGSDIPISKDACTAGEGWRRA
jgi:hypothetical protein